LDIAIFLMVRRIFIVMTCIFALSACGGAGPVYYDDVPTGSSPIVSRVDPASGPVGTTVTIYGLGFSFEAPTNVVTMGTEGVAAESYNILAAPTDAEIETITFMVPAGLAPGTYPVVVVVHDAASDTAVSFTVTP
jgi:hypothetical protein